MAGWSEMEGELMLFVCMCVYMKGGEGGGWGESDDTAAECLSDILKRASVTGGDR